MSRNNKRQPGVTRALYSMAKVKRLALKRPTAPLPSCSGALRVPTSNLDGQRPPLQARTRRCCTVFAGHTVQLQDDRCDLGNDRPQIENCSRTSADSRTGRPVCAFMGHQSVRAVDNNWPSLLLRISVNRSNLSRVALPTQVRNTTSSPRQAGVL